MKQGRRCGTCRWFEADPAAIEAALPGLTILSSAYGSARADAGLCSRHGWFLSEKLLCEDYEASPPARG